MSSNPVPPHLPFENCTAIEVRPDDEGFFGSWYEATILSIIHTKQNPNLYYDVEYKTLLDEDETSPLKERVRGDFIRPIPPQQKEQEVFGLEDVVEAFYQDGWWIGVITKVLLYNKLFEVTFSNPPDRMRFGVSELRVHLDWVGGEWVRPQTNAKKMHEGKHLKVDKSEDQTTASMKRKGRPSKIQRKSSASSVGGVDIAEGQERGVTINQTSDQSKSKEKNLQKNDEMPTKTLGENGEPENGLSNEKKMDLPGKGKTVASSDQTGMNFPKRRRTRNADSSVDNVSDETINMEKLEEGPKEANDRSKVGRAAGACPNRNVQDITDSRIANGSEFVKQAVASAASVERNGGEVINPNNEFEIMKRVAAVEENRGKIIDSNNEELEIAAAANTAVEVNVIDINNEKIEIEKGSAVEGNFVDSNDQKLPFVKTFPLWNQIESMQVFQTIPQRPHFRMLVDACPENCREGMAIGYMVTFCSVVKKVNELRWDNPRAYIEDCFETLAKLEENGFDVKVIHDRLSSLLSKKVEHSLLLDQLKEHENQIIEHNYEKTKMVEEIDELDKQIKELLEKRDLAMSMGESVEHETACYESTLNSVRQEINNQLFAFKQAAASPW